MRAGCLPKTILGLRAIPVLALLLGALAADASAQDCPVTTDVGTYPATPLTYPMTSNRYAVQYQLAGAGTWTNAQVYISYYGGTNSSPYITHVIPRMNRYRS
jgi:hypothetical protein